MTEAGKRLVADPDLCWPEPGPDLTDAILAIEVEAFADGIDRAAERVLSFWRAGDTLADIVSHIRGEQP